jgi:hypothetical protein
LFFVDNSIPPLLLFAALVPSVLLLPLLALKLHSQVTLAMGIKGLQCNGRRRRQACRLVKVQATG